MINLNWCLLQSKISKIVFLFVLFLKQNKDLKNLDKKKSYFDPKQNNLNKHAIESSESCSSEDEEENIIFLPVSEEECKLIYSENSNLTGKCIRLTKNGYTDVNVFCLFDC